MFFTKVAEACKPFKDLHTENVAISCMAGTVLCTFPCLALFVTVLGFDTNPWPCLATLRLQRAYYSFCRWHHCLSHKFNKIFNFAYIKNKIYRMIIIKTINKKYDYEVGKCNFFMPYMNKFMNSLLIHIRV